MERIVFIDIDHTVADAFWRDPMLKFDDWDAYHNASLNDDPIRETIAVLDSLHADEWFIIGLTGRNERYRQLTMRWCLDHGVMMDELIMRPDDDYTPTAEYKFKAANDRMNQLPKGTLVIVFDDRDDVVQAFKAENWTVFQIHAGGGNGKAEI